MTASAVARRRLFFALWPDDAVRTALLAATRKLVRACGGRPVTAENLHVTLAFLGSVAQPRVASVRAAAQTVSGEPFALRFDGVAHFPRSGVLTLLAAESPAALQELEAGLRSALAVAGFELDPRPFRPHLTVARKVARVPAGAALQRPVLWRPVDFALVESVTERRGADYSVLVRWPLAVR